MIYHSEELDGEMAKFSKVRLELIQRGLSRLYPNWKIVGDFKNQVWITDGELTFALPEEMKEVGIPAIDIIKWIQRRISEELFLQDLLG